METKIAKGLLTVNVSDLIDCLDDEGRKDIIETLACHDSIIALVAEQIVDGWTEAGYHGGITYGPMPHTPLDKAKRYLAKSASDVAKKQIERLETIAVDACKKADEEQTKRLDSERRVYDLQGELRQYVHYPA